MLGSKYLSVLVPEFQPDDDSTFCYLANVFAPFYFAEPYLAPVHGLPPGLVRGPPLIRFDFSFLGDGLALPLALVPREVDLDLPDCALSRITTGVGCICSRNITLSALAAKASYSV